MAAGIPGSLLVQGKFPLDDKYWVDTKNDLPKGLIYDGQCRWTKDTHQLYVNENNVWKLIPTFSPLLSNEITGTAQGIVGLGLREAVLWLANNRCCDGDTTTPTPTTYNAVSQSYTTTLQDYSTKCSTSEQFTPITKTSTNGTSTVSQADANSKALADARTQAINAIVCPVATTYTSTKTATASCDSVNGSYGSSVTRSSTQTSTISQDDADTKALNKASADANAALVCYTFNTEISPGNNKSTINFNGGVDGLVLLANFPLSTNTDPNPASMIIVASDGVTQLGQADYSGWDTGARIGIRYNGVVQIASLTNGNVVLT